MTRAQELTLVLLYLTVSTLLSAASGIQVGSSHEEVLQQFGKPDGELSAGSKLILIYGEERIIFVDNKVTSISDKLTQKINVAGSSQQPAKSATGNSAPASTYNTTWLTNYAQATAIAKKENKKLFINFTGSDWCGWCIRLDKEVFAQKGFNDYAKKHYVLLKLDFPRGHKLPDSVQQQNDTLANKYNVRGFPSIVVLNSNGTHHKTSGYISGGPKAFLKTVK